jgi:hypothetical protein
MTNKRKILDVTKPFNDDAVMYNSWYKPWANTTVSWVAGDDEAKYKTHLKEKYDVLMIEKNTPLSWLDGVCVIKELISEDETINNPTDLGTTIIDTLENKVYSLKSGNEKLSGNNILTLKLIN